MKAKRPPMNWDRVLFNIREAREHLETLEKELTNPAATSGKKAASLEVWLGHVYQHLNAGWRGRRWPKSRYSKLTNRDHKLLSQWPTDLWIPGMHKPGE